MCMPMRLVARVGCVVSFALPLYLTAAEVAVLDNGMRIQAERIERTDGRAILHTPGGGEIDIDAARLAEVEHVDDPVAAQPAPPPQAAAQVPQKSVQELVTDAALRYGLPPALVHGVVQAESAYQPAAVSPKGAIGVMQLMPGTARKYEADPANPEQNIDAGTRLLRDLLVRYEGSENRVRRALAAYNAGEDAVSRYGGVPPYRETQGYVERVIGLYWKNVRTASMNSAAVLQSTAAAPASEDSGSGAGTK